MSEDIASYTSKQFQCVLQDFLIDVFRTSSFTARQHPKAVLLGGQSGAGKTALHNLYNKLFNNDVVIINGDEYRSKHPRYYELNAKYGAKSVSYTAAWAGAMTEALINEFSRSKYNLVIEGTLRTTEIPIKTATLLRERGYDVSLALMAVKPEISLVSCQIRYEQMRVAGTTPRATDPKHHAMIVNQIVKNLSVLEKSGLFSKIYLYSRSKEQLYPKEGVNISASKALEEILFGSWTEEETVHYKYLQKKLENLKNS